MSVVSVDLLGSTPKEIAMPSWSSDRRFGKNLDEQKRDRDQRYRDARAEASTEYLADIASEGPDCGDD